LPKPQAKELIARVRFLLKDQSPGLLETHIKATKVLADSSKQSSSADAAVTKAADALRSALTAKKDKTSLTQLISALEQAPIKDAAKKDANSGNPKLAKSASTTKDTPQQPPVDYAFSLISAAADATGHLPKQTLLNCEEREPRTLLEWSQEASVASLQQVHLYLPDPGGAISQTLQLEPLQDKPGQPLISWQCIAGDGEEPRAIGVFEINEKSLVFERAKGSPADLAGLPFLPICIATEGSKPTWVQLMKPVPFKGVYLPMAEEEKHDAAAENPQPEPQNANAIAIPLSIGDSEKPLIIPSGVERRWVLRDAAITIKAENNQIQIAPYRTFAFDTKATFPEIPFDAERMRFWWRPRNTSTAINDSPSGFADLGWLDWEQINLRHQISLQILWERDLAEVVIISKQRDAEVGNGDWRRALVRIASWGLDKKRLPEPFAPLSAEVKEIRNANELAVDAILLAPKKPYSSERMKWENQKAKVSKHIDNLTSSLRGSGRFRDYVEQRILSQEPSLLQNQNPDGKEPPTEELKSLRKAALAQKTREACEKDTNLRLWVEEVLSGPQAATIDKSELLHMWLWRYLYRVADANPLAGVPGESKDSQKTWSDALRAATISVEGDVVFPWKSSDFVGPHGMPADCQTLIATSRDIRPPAAPEPPPEKK
jgi:hypothetical protein